MEPGRVRYTASVSCTATSGVPIRVSRCQRSQSSHVRRVRSKPPSSSNTLRRMRQQCTANGQKRANAGNNSGSEAGRHSLIVSPSAPTRIQPQYAPPATGSSRSGAASRSRALGRSQSSASRNNNIAPRASATPTVREAPTPPPPRGTRRMRASEAPAAATSRAVSSVDPSSTTTASHGRHVWPRSDSSVCPIVAAAFRAATTTETRVAGSGPTGRGEIALMVDRCRGRDDRHRPGRRRRHGAARPHRQAQFACQVADHLRQDEAHLLGDVHACPKQRRRVHAASPQPLETVDPSLWEELARIGKETAHSAQRPVVQATMRGQPESEQKGLPRQVPRSISRGMIDLHLRCIHDARAVSRRTLTKLLLLTVRTEALVESAELLDEPSLQPEVRAGGEAALDVSLLVEMPGCVDEGATRRALDDDRDTPCEDVDRLRGEAGNAELEPIRRRKAVRVRKGQDRGTGGADTEIAARGETDMVECAHDDGPALSGCERRRRIRGAVVNDNEFELVARQSLAAKHLEEERKSPLLVPGRDDHGYARRRHRDSIKSRSTRWCHVQPAECRVGDLDGLLGRRDAPTHEHRGCTRKVPQPSLAQCEAQILARGVDAAAGRAVTHDEPHGELRPRDGLAQLLGSSAVLPAEIDAFGTDSCQFPIVHVRSMHPVTGEDLVAYDGGPALEQPYPHVPVGKRVELLIEAAGPSQFIRSDDDGRRTADEVRPQYSAGKLSGVRRPPDAQWTTCPVDVDHTGVAEHRVSPGDCGELLSQLVRDPNVVVVEEGDPLAGRSGDAEIAGGCHTPGSAAPQHAQPAVVDARERSRSVVDRAIVDYDDFQSCTLLASHGFQRVEEQCGAVPRRDDDADQR